MTFFAPYPDDVYSHQVSRAASATSTSLGTALTVTGYNPIARFSSRVLALLPMNQCIFSPDRIYRYVLRRRCTESAPEGSRCQPLKVGLASEAALHESEVGEVGRSKHLSTANRIAWIGLNPSTADEITLDQTSAAVCRYSRKWGFTEVVMLNLFAFRATDPRDLKLATDPIGPDNDKHLLEEICSVDRVIACWGDHGRFLGRDRQVSDLLSVSYECLRKNRSGAPHHPLYLKSRIKPKPFGLDQIRN